MREFDDYDWLEEIDGDAALDWVAEQNAIVDEAIKDDPRYQRFFDNIRSKLIAEDRSISGRYFDGYIYNFWQDEGNPRGIWRRARLDQYLRDGSFWEILLDIDKLNAAEHSDWVFRGANFLAPSETKVLLSLSDGGKDTVVIREFDLAERAFVSGGFETSLAKQSAAWFDRDHLLVASSADPLGASKSGYGIVVRMIGRRMTIANAPVIYRGEADDMAVQISKVICADELMNFITRRKNFFESTIYRLERDRSLTQLFVPTSAKFAGVCERQLLLRVKEPWNFAGECIEPGTIVSFDLDTLKRSSMPRVHKVFMPDARSSVTAVSARQNDVILVVSKDVKSLVFRAEFQDKGWTTEKIALPDFGTVTVDSADGHSNVALLSFSSFLEPTTQYLLDGRSAPRRIRAASEQFDSAPYTVTQRFASSSDETAIPYFLVNPAIPPDGSKLPLLLFGYGGFERSIRPHYLPPMVQEWLNSGGAYAVANIRGGGEYGPKWHRAALRDKRVLAFDDFISVAEDLISTGVSSPQLLGIKGGSNGGLLMGAMLTRRPDLFGAIICRVPLLDMLRYHNMQAGASWIAEYGDPDDARDRAYLEKISPYHNLAFGREYPKVFFITSSGDDRVHPGHARKMHARMRGMGYDCFFFECLSGGHQTAADAEQMARNAAMELVYLHQQLIDQSGRTE